MYRILTAILNGSIFLVFKMKCLSADKDIKI